MQIGKGLAVPEINTEFLFTIALEIQVGLLRELVPAATLIGFLVNPRNPITERNVRDALDAAQKLGAKIQIVHASSEARDRCRVRYPARHASQRAARTA